MMALIACASSTAAEDWTRFRGKYGAGISTDKDIPVRWSATNNMKWKVALPGPGASSPVTWKDRVYVTCYSGYGVDPDEPGKMSDLKRHLLCIRRSDGHVLWQQVMKSRAPVSPDVHKRPEHGYASHTPTVDEHGVYAFYGSSGVVSYTHAGRLRWHFPCGDLWSGYGSAASPILHKNLLIVSANVESSSIIALNTRTGQEVWRKETTRSNWATPIVVPRGDGHVLICFKDVRVAVGLDPMTGRELWEFKGDFARRYTCISPVYSDGIVMMGGLYGGVAFRLGGSGDVSTTHRLWKHPQWHGQSTPLSYKGVFLWLSGGSHMDRQDWETGQRAARPIGADERSPGPASPVIVDGKVYFVSQTNGTIVWDLAAGTQTARNVIEGDDSFFNGSPAISNGQLFLRSDKYLYCVAKE